jgi:glutamate formiminotransferase/formiminotetrahydrofolate cyclodeaminase
VAFDVREKGRVLRDGGSLTGDVIRDSEGNAQYAPGALKNVKAIGWFIEEYGIAQVSINLTNMRETPLHEVFEACVEKANLRGIRVTGSELVGLVPLQALKIAVRSMGLDELSPFDPHTRVIEYAVEQGQSNRLADLSIRQFVDETASESPAPGGGSVSAAIGAMGAALGTMVANLSSHKRGWDERWREFSDWADRGKVIQNRLVGLIDLDTEAFNALMTAFGLPKSTDAEKAERKKQIQEATLHASEIPLEVMRVACQGFEVVKAMAELGNPNSITDAGVGALALRTAVMGAYLNVRINVGALEDPAAKQALLVESAKLRALAVKLEAEVLDFIEEKLS